MNVTTNPIVRQVVFTGIRWAVNFAGAWLVGKGYFDGEQATQFAGGVLSLIALGWSATRSSTKISVPKADARAAGLAPPK